MYFLILAEGSYGPLSEAELDMIMGAYSATRFVDYIPCKVSS